MIVLSSSIAQAAISEADAKYAQLAGKATQEFSTAIGNWGDTYQGAPDKVNSPEYRKLVKKANDALMAATTLFTNWGNEFAKDTSRLAQ